MTDAFKYIDVNDEQFEDAPKALRDAYAALKKQHEATNAEVSTLRGQVASQALSGVLNGFKSPKKVERDLLADGIDATDKVAVEAWLADNGDDYTRVEATPNPDATQATTQVSPEVQAGYGQLNSLGAQVRQPADLSKLQAAQAELTADATPEQVLAAFAKHGV